MPSLSTLLALKQQAVGAADVYGVFTRGEEVGLLGSILVAQQRLLPLQTMVVSVESSRTLPGAEIGKGPVIRVGDFRRTFNHEVESYLLAAWEALRNDDPQTKSATPAPQRRHLRGHCLQPVGVSRHRGRAAPGQLP